MREKFLFFLPKIPPLPRGNKKRRDALTRFSSILNPKNYLSFFYRKKKPFPASLVQMDCHSPIYDPPSISFFGVKKISHFINPLINTTFHILHIFQPQKHSLTFKPSLYFLTTSATLLSLIFFLNISQRTKHHPNNLKKLSTSFTNNNHIVKFPTTTSNLLAKLVEGPFVLSTFHSRNVRFYVFFL